MLNVVQSLHPPSKIWVSFCEIFLWFKIIIFFILDYFEMEFICEIQILIFSSQNSSIQSRITLEIILYADLISVVSILISHVYL